MFEYRCQIGNTLDIRLVQISKVWMECVTDFPVNIQHFGIFDLREKSLDRLCFCSHSKTKTIVHIAQMALQTMPFSHYFGITSKIFGNVVHLVYIILTCTCWERYWLDIWTFALAYQEVPDCQCTCAPASSFGWRHDFIEFRISLTQIGVLLI